MNSRLEVTAFLLPKDPTPPLLLHSRWWGERWFSRQRHPTVSLGRDRPVANRQRARFAHVNLLREPIHRPLDGNVDAADDVLDLALRDDQRRRKAEVVLHGDADDAL